MSSTDLVPTMSTAVDTSPEWESPAARFEHQLFREDGDMDADLAREVVAKIDAYATVLWRLVGRAHERRIWLALGYNSWLAFVSAEFDISRSRAYQLVHQYRANRALGAGDAGDEELLARGDVRAMSEAQARPLGKLVDDARAVRQIWERALQLALGQDPTATDVEHAVAEYRNPKDFTPPAEPLVTGLVGWISGPVWFWWKTPPEGTVLYVGLGEPRHVSAMEKDAWFVSEPRIGDPADIRALDAGGLLPWVIAELLTGGRTMPELDAARAIASLELAHMDRGPHSVEKGEIVAAVSSAPTDEWADVSADGMLLDRPVPSTLTQFSYAWRAQSDSGGQSYRLDVWCDGDHLLWSSENRPWSGGSAEAQADARTVLPQVMAEALLGRAASAGEVAAVAELGLSCAKPKKKLDPFWIERSFIARQLGLEPGPRWGERNTTADEEDEVLRGELVDRSAAAPDGAAASSAPEPSPPGGSAAATDADGGGDPATSPSSAPRPAPSPEAKTLAKLRQDVQKMDADELTKTVTTAIDVAERTTDPADARLAAVVLRSMASRFEDRASALARDLEEGAA